MMSRAEMPDEHAFGKRELAYCCIPNGDGILDLVLKFKTSETGLQSGDTSVLLEGNLLPELGGDFFSVEQAITVVNGRGKGRKK